jgi:two-component system NarL family response regulator
MLNLLIVDDHILFREGLASLFKAQPDFAVLGEAGNVREAIEKARSLKPDLILMDFSLPDGTGLDATEVILAEMPQVKIVFLTMHEDDERLFAAIQAGAKGYLLKNIPVTKLLLALRGIERGEAPLSRSMTTRVLQEFSRIKSAREQAPAIESGLEELTDREREVMQELVRGGSNKDIADRLFISENTVKNHVHNILEKLKLTSRRDIVRYAQRKPGK